MLASYESSPTHDLTAVYHYCCSLLVKHPFLTSADNLAAAFERNKSRLSQKSSSSGGGGGGEGRKSKSGGSSFVLSDLVMRFVFVHGALFSLRRATAAAAAAAGGANMHDEHAITATVVAAVQSINTQLPALLEDLDRALVGTGSSSSSSSILPEAELPLIKMLVVCFFSVHFSAVAVTTATAASESESNSSSSSRPSSPCVSISLVILFSFISRIALRIVSVSGGSGGSSDSRTRKSTLGRLLPVLSVFADWGTGVVRCGVRDDQPISLIPSSHIA